MCRHVAYLGSPVSLREVLIDPPFGLHRQAWAPRRQRYGTVNADGFGAGWYAEGDPVPARYRQAVPMWTDDSFADVARVTRTRSLLAAVRSATEGTAPDASAACPFRDGPYLFSHNGVVAGWPGTAAGLAGLLPAAMLLDLPARTDSALVWALVRHRLAGGATMAGALARTVRDVAGHADGRLNLLITDGESIAATAYGDTLTYRVDDRGVVVASEPSDDTAGWVDVPDASLLVARGGEVSVTPIEAAATEEP
jgi:gamma-glutamyl hercynylcysteine S-oxide hydrolase